MAKSLFPGMYYLIIRIAFSIALQTHHRQYDGIYTIRLVRELNAHLAHKEAINTYTHTHTDYVVHVDTHNYVVNPHHTITHAHTNGHDSQQVPTIATLASSNIAEQTQQCLDKIDALLAEAGTSKSKLLEVCFPIQVAIYFV
jgi:hypothetical protein